LENRCRLVCEIVSAVSSVMGHDRVGVKITPGGRYNDMFDSDPVGLYTQLLKEMSKLKIAFVEIVQPMESPMVVHFQKIKGEEQIPNCFKTFKPHFNGVVIANSGLDYNKGNDLIKQGLAHMVSFATHFIGNPDLVERFKNGHELAPPDWSTAYGGSEKGYTDYPVYSKK